MPYHFDVISDKPKKQTTQTLKAVTRILQKLSNGTTFKNEVEFVPTNVYLESKRNTFQNFIYDITDVEGLDFEMVLYELNKHKRDRKVTVQTSYNQLLLFHRLLWNYRNEICKAPNDPMLPVLLQLGPPIEAPYPDKPKSKRYRLEDNYSVVLYLKTPGGEKDLFDTDQPQQFDNSELFSSSTNRPEPIERALASMIAFGKAVDTAQYPKELTKGHDFLSFLNHVVHTDGEAKDVAQACIFDISEAVEYLKMETGQPYSSRELVISFSEQIRVYRSSSRRLRKHVSDVHEAWKSIQKHQEDLKNKIEYFKQYLNSVRMGNANNQVQENDHTVRQTTLTHAEMRKKKIISWFNPSLEGQVKKSATYTFRRVSSGEYEIDAVVKKMGFKIFQDVVPVSMLKILEMEDNHQDRWDLNEHIAVNVNLLKKFLCDTFQDYRI